MSSEKNTDFAVFITFDCRTKHSEITKFLDDNGIKKSSLSNNEIPNNTYSGVVSRTVEMTSEGNFSSATLKTMSERIAKKFREMLKDFFGENDIDGKIYVIVSWKLATKDTVTD